MEKESFKPRNQGVFYRLVNPTKIEADKLPVGIRPLAELYIEGWIEVHIHIFMSDEGEWCTLWYTAYPSEVDYTLLDSKGSVHAERPFVTADYEIEVPVLVNVVEPVQQSQKPTIVPSVVWLFPLNRCLDFWRDQPPHQMVEGRAIVEQCITDDGVQLGRRVIQPTSQLVQFVASLSLNLNGDFMQLKSGKGIHLSLVAVQMAFRSLYLEIGAFEERMYMLSLYHANHTKNRQGPRNPRANKGQRVQGAGKGGGANHAAHAVNSPTPPEQVASQTEPSRPLGGYTAKHTHSGSPEDA